MNLDEYLDSLGLEADERAQMATILGKAGDKATAPLLMRADYTKKTQDLAKERERIAAEQAQMSKEYTAALKQLEEGRITQAGYEAKIERLGKEWGLPEEEWRTPVKVATEPVKVAPQMDPAILARLEQAEKNYGVSPEISAVLMDLQSEYGDVFGSGKGFSAAALLKYSRENRVPLRGERDPETGQLLGGPGAFERLYKIGEKRHELLVKSITEKADKDAEARHQQRIDQQLAGRATGEHNPNGWAANGSHLLSGQFKQNQASRIEASAKESGRTVEPPSQGRSAAENELGGAGAAFAKAFLSRRAKGVGYGQDDRAA